MQIRSIAQHPALMERAARWFHEKWDVPLQAYVESMQSSLQTQTGVPAWYVIADEQDNIVAGLGVIENDFHKRPDLTPNICAVYVEEAYRMRGLSRKLLDHACRELHKKGIADAYLITTHTRYYEHCGWTFYTMVEEDEGDMVRMYHRKTGLL